MLSKEHINQIKKITDKPVCVGFGVSTEKQVEGLSRYCDGVIVGSAIITHVEKYLKHKEAIPAKVAGFVKELTRGLK